MFGYYYGGGDCVPCETDDYLVEYNYSFKNVASGGTAYDGILNSGGYLCGTTIYELPVIDVTDIVELVYGIWEAPYITRVDVSEQDTYTFELDARVNNIMLFDQTLSDLEYENLMLNPNQWDINNVPDKLIEWYPCTEYNLDHINDTLGTKTYTVEADKNWVWEYSSSPNGLQAIKYDKVDRTLKSFYSPDGIPINNEKDYIDTQWIPMYNVAWEIEFESHFSDTNNYNVSGVYKDSNADDSTYLNIGEISSNRVYTRLGDTYALSDSLSNGWHHLHIKYDGIDTLDTYIDGVLDHSITNTYTNYTRAFWLGWSNVGNGSETMYKNLKIKEV